MSKKIPRERDFLIKPARKMRKTVVLRGAKHIEKRQVLVYN